MLDIACKYFDVRLPFIESLRGFVSWGFVGWKKMGFVSTFSGTFLNEKSMYLSKFSNTFLYYIRRFGNLICQYHQITLQDLITYVPTATHVIMLYRYNGKSAGNKTYTCVMVIFPAGGPQEPIWAPGRGREGERQRGRRRSRSSGAAQVQQLKSSRL